MPAALRRRIVVEAKTGCAERVWKRRQPATSLFRVSEMGSSAFQLPTFAAAFERQLQRQKLESKESVVIRC